MFFIEFLSLQIPHSLTLMEQYDLLCIADRENMRVICVKAELNGYDTSSQMTSLNIQQPDLGRVFAIAAHGKKNCFQVRNFKKLLTKIIYVHFVYIFF